MPLASAAAPSRVGRHGVALARFARAGGRTYLADSYFRVPLQVMRPNYPEGEITCPPDAHQPHGRARGRRPPGVGNKPR